MKSENTAAIKKEDKKLKKKYFVFMALALVGGFLVGFLSAFLTDIFEGGLEQMLARATYFLTENASLIGIVTGLLAAVLVAIIYLRNRKRYAEWDGEDEEILQKIETELSIAVLITNISTILFVILLGIGSVKAIRFTWDSMGIYWVAIAVNVVVELIANNKIVNFSKKINPEKRGSTYDMKFQKKWFDSCDEAERLNIYKASYASYKAVTVTCTVLWFVCLFGMMLFDCGIMPVILVGTIWMVSNVSYCVEAIRLSKNS